MKKLFSVILVVSIVVGLVACGGTNDTWQVQYDLGIKLLEDGNYEEAIIAFSKAIEIDEKMLDAYVYKAEAEKALGLDEDAVETYTSMFTVIIENDIIEVPAETIDAYQWWQNRAEITDTVKDISDWFEGNKEILRPIEKEKSEFAKKEDERIVTETFDCVGMTKAELVELYGPIIEDYYYNGGKIYKHRDINFWLFYDVWEDSSFDFNKTDDVKNHHKCYGIYASPAEVITTCENGETYTADEIAEVFGAYDKEYDDMMDYVWLYTYKFRGHDLVFESFDGEDNIVSVYYRIK